MPADVAVCEGVPAAPAGCAPHRQGPATQENLCVHACQCAQLEAEPGSPG